MANFEVRGRGPPVECKCGTIWRVPLKCRRAPSMVDQRWRTARDQRRVQRWMLDNIFQAHAYADLRYARSVQKYGVCLKRPFFERPSIVHPTYWLFVFGSVETPKPTILIHVRRHVSIYVCFYFCTVSPHGAVGNHRRGCLLKQDMYVCVYTHCMCVCVCVFVCVYMRAWEYVALSFSRSLSLSFSLSLLSPSLSFQNPSMYVQYVRARAGR